MAMSIMSHRVHRGSLVHQIADVQFVNLKQALCAASAAHALHDLYAQRMNALAIIKGNIRHEAAFSATRRQEAKLAAQMRRLLRRHPNGNDVPLTGDDQYIFQRASKRQEVDRLTCLLKQVEVQS